MQSCAVFCNPTLYSAAAHYAVGQDIVHRSSAWFRSALYRVALCYSIQSGTKVGTPYICRAAQHSALFHSGGVLHTKRPQLSATAPCSTTKSCLAKFCNEQLRAALPYKLRCYSAGFRIGYTAPHYQPNRQSKPPECSTVTCCPTLFSQLAAANRLRSERAHHTGSTVWSLGRNHRKGSLFKPNVTTSSR